MQTPRLGTLLVGLAAVLAGAAALRKDYLMLMSAGDVVSATFKYYKEYDELRVAVCDGDSCSRLEMSAVTPDGELRYKALTWCDNGNPSCDTHHTNEPAGAKPFPAGEMVLMVQRRPFELQVWLQDHEDKKAAVPLKTSTPRQRVWIRPTHYNTPDMPLQVKFVKEAP